MASRGATKSERAIVERVVGEWRDSLVNLTGRNRLLNFRASKTSTVTLAPTDPSVVVAGLLQGVHYRFHSPEPEDDGADAESGLPMLPAPRQPVGPVLECVDIEEVVAKALRNLLRRSTAEFMDRGLWILYLAVGVVRWIDIDGTRYSSPLLLVPVELESPGPKQPLTLHLASDEALINPALTLKFREFDINLPECDELTAESATQMIDQARSAVEGHPAWQVSQDMHLSYFSFHKDAMYRDLMENVSEIVEHPLVQAFALGGTSADFSGSLFDPVGDDSIDVVAPPESAALVLDADSSQRACVVAALQGRSFVIDGPPGTGKSQTITNVIAELLNAGRSVLFVSEKMAALEVVQTRLREVGLDSYAMELHSHKATRKEFATALGHALGHQPIPPAGLRATDRRTLEYRRKALSDYAVSMNRIRQPLGFSLHHVLGHLSELHDVPASPPPPIDVTALSPDQLSALREQSDRLARAWRPARQGRNFLWREVTARGPQDRELTQALRALNQLREIVATNQPVADTFGLTHPSDAARLFHLVEAFAARHPQTPLQWLELETLEPVTRTATALEQKRRRMTDAAAVAFSATGRPWTEIPSRHALPVADIDRLSSLSPTAVPLDGLTSVGVSSLRTDLADQVNRLSDVVADLTAIAARLGRNPAANVEEAESLLTLTRLCLGSDRPPRSWLSRSGVAAATTATDSLRQAQDQLATATEQASAYFTERALSVDATALSSRFANVHRGLHKLGGAYRADRRVVGEIAVPGVGVRDAIEQLPLVEEWIAAVDRLGLVEQQQASILAQTYRGAGTDWSAVGRLLAVAHQAVSECPDLQLDALAAVLASDTAPPSELTPVVDRAAAGLHEWRTGVGAPLSDQMPAPVLALPLEQALGWLRAHDRPLEAALFVLNTVAGDRGAELTLARARQVLDLRHSAEDATAAWIASQEEFADRLGPSFEGEQTDTDAIREAITWARGIRQFATRQPSTETALTTAQIKALAAAVPTAAGHIADATWETCRDTVVSAFSPTRHLELLEELDDYTDGADLIQSLLDDAAGQDEWFNFEAARRSLTDAGLADTLRFCVEDDIAPALVPDVVEKALMTAWADAVIASDDALRDTRSVDRDALVAQFRELDEQLVKRTVADILTNLNERRPTLAAGQASVIQREAAKQKRHMPVRKLIDSAQDVIRAIKPCFMMSPLAVSQYLPAGMRFDVVIFDEASQVTPADSINCIYRGTSLIIAGDQKQLPPTEFFAAGIDADSDEWVEGESDATDFKSVLDIAKSSGAMTSLTLRWHYRSRHEDLIAFSNASFYGGELITFPGAMHSADHVGVELFKVPGQYRRGSTRDNPAEAAVVAERVIHHFDTRPQLTLGVVAFSEAQATAIETAIDEARLLRPDLDSHFDDDRLDGFFVKNLESVQGDERDVMLFSIGYGPDENGKIWNNFGPLNKAGGWRRLNVAITRARYRNEIISSIEASDVSDSTNESVRHFRRYLDYAARGAAALALDDRGSLGGPESPFEDSVISAVRSLGYDVTPQVGAAGYRIDMGVPHPDRPGVFMLGIECDGLMYHSSKAARDRDRLRQQVLEGLGWRLHRIWGTAWYRNRDHELERLARVLETATAAPIVGLAGGLRRRTFSPVEVERFEFADTPEWAEPYELAKVKRLPSWLDPGEPGAHHHMVGAIEQVVALEAPVHLTVLEARLRTGWGIQRIGSRIRINLNSAIKQAQVVREGDFLTSGDAPAGRVRVPADDEVRTVTQVHDSEMEAALLGFARDAGGLTREELTLHVSRLFGWQRRGSDIGERLDALINGLIAFGALQGNDERLVYRESTDM